MAAGGQIELPAARAFLQYLHSAEAIGRWCGAQQPLGSLAAGNIPKVFLRQW